MSLWWGDDLKNTPATARARKGREEGGEKWGEWEFSSQAVIKLLLCTTGREPLGTAVLTHLEGLWEERVRLDLGEVRGSLLEGNAVRVGGREEGALGALTEAQSCARAVTEVEVVGEHGRGLREG